MPATAEVKPVDGIEHALMSHCALQPDFVNERTALVEAVFRLFLVNGNVPMSAEELGERLHRPPETILKNACRSAVHIAGSDPTNKNPAPVAQRTEHQPSKLAIRVRFPAGAPKLRGENACQIKNGRISLLFDFTNQKVGL